jgi:hypothetical protein
MLLTGVSLLAALNGCAFMSRKFTAGTKADIGLFADNTIALLSELDLSLHRDETVYIRRFFDDSGEEEKHLNFLSDNMVIALSNIVEYSITTVNLRSYLVCLWLFLLHSMYFE